MPWHRLERPAATAGDRPTRVVIGDHALIIAELGGTWHALEDRCSHAGCAFSEDGVLEGDRLVCDCHGSEFDVRTGAVLRSPARAPIDVYEVRAADGHVEVRRP